MTFLPIHQHTCPVLWQTEKNGGYPTLLETWLEFISVEINRHLNNVDKLFIKKLAVFSS